MANKNLLKSKAVLKAISIGLAAMMAMTPVVGATDVYADDVDGNEPESNESNISESQSESSENNTQSSENNTQAVEESYEQAKKDLVPEYRKMQQLQQILQMALLLKKLSLRKLLKM